MKKQTLLFTGAILASIALLSSLFTVTAQDSTLKTANVLAYAGVPSNGTNEVDTLTLPAGTTGGTFTLTPAGSRATAAIAHSTASATILANISAALGRLNVVGGTGGVTVAAGTLAAGTGTILISFTGTNAKKDMPLLSINAASLAGGTAATITTGTAGVEATYRNAPTGQLLLDTVTPDLYINDSTTPANGPTWTKVSP